MEKKRGTYFQYLVIAALIGAGFWTGTLYQQVKLLRSGGSNVAGVGAEGGAQNPEVQQPVNLTEDNWKKLLDKPAASLGEDGAKVTMVEFVDYQCPFCKRAFDSNFSQIDKDYIKTGKLKYVMRDLPLPFHPNSKPAALAARCAGEQGKYAEMHEKLYSTQEEWSSLTDATAKFKSYAEGLGLEANKFGSCIAEKKYEKEIDADTTLAGEVGATGTPTFYINGKQIVGAQPVSAFQTMIDEALKQ